MSRMFQVSAVVDPRPLQEAKAACTAQAFSLSSLSLVPVCVPRADSVQRKYNQQLADRTFIRRTLGR
jgi:hypothetical protein